jgi:hypothetical protein
MSISYPTVSQWVAHLANTNCFRAEHLILFCVVRSAEIHSSYDLLTISQEENLVTVQLSGYAKHLNEKTRIELSSLNHDSGMQMKPMYN